jgi:hypothetical protein
MNRVIKNLISVTTLGIVSLAGLASAESKTGHQLQTKCRVLNQPQYYAIVTDRTFQVIHRNVAKNFIQVRGKLGGHDGNIISYTVNAFKIKKFVPDNQDLAAMYSFKDGQWTKVASSTSSDAEKYVDIVSDSLESNPFNIQMIDFSTAQDPSTYCDR